MYAPQELRADILRLEHSSPQAGHPSINQMYASPRSYYCWETMASDVHNHLEACTSGARNWLTQRKKTCRLRLFPAAEPFAT